MILLAGFLDVLFRAFVFIGLSWAVGGIVFYWVVLRPLGEEPTVIRMARRSGGLAAMGGFLAGISQLLTVVIAPWALADESGRWPLDAFMATGFARWGMLHALLGICLGAVCLRIRRGPCAPRAWNGAALVALPVLVSGAWLVHGASRLDHAAILMSVTVIHQVAALIWLGGTMHLSIQWLLLRHSPDKGTLWPPLPARFSPLAMGSVALLVTAGTYLSWYYVGGVGGLLGTAYGTMLLTKVALMGCLLFLGGLNFLAIRRWRASGSTELVMNRVPSFVELEAAIGITILMAAAALTGQPPAIDVTAEQATPAEVLRVFAPKMPQLTPAPFAAMQSEAQSSLDPYAMPTELQKIQSDFNHNVSGIFVILLGVAALVSRGTGARWARHWPLLFLPFALFLLIVAEPTGWPLGREGFWETLAAPDVLQHRLATLLVVGLGLFEWRVQVGGLAATPWRYAFPLLCGVGGALLLTHSHSVFALKWAFLIEVSHNAIGILAVMMGGGRWLELQLPEGEGRRAAGLLWPLCFIMVGVVLLVYRET